MNSEAKVLARRRSELELEDRHKVVGKEIVRVKQEMTSRGMLHSGMTVVQIESVVAREYRIRAGLVWSALARALQASGEKLTDEFCEEAKEFIREVVEDNSADLPESLEKARNLSGGGGRPLDYEQLLDEALQRIYTEVDYAGLQTSSTQDVSSSEGQINIYQSYGIVQTGPHSIANLTISLGSEEKEAIRQALEVAERTIADDGSLSERERSEVLELLADAQTEAEKEEPNGLRLRGALQGVASTVQTLAAGPQAYELLKGAGALIGLYLP